jgi:hypothetical protein
MITLIPCWDLCINLKYKNKSRIIVEAIKRKEHKEFMGGSVFDTYIHNYKLALRTALCSLTLWFTVHRSLFIIEYIDLFIIYGKCSTFQIFISKSASQMMCHHLMKWWHIFQNDRSYEIVTLIWELNFEKKKNWNV